VKLPAQNCFPIPQGYSFEEAAAFPLVFITLWRMLITNAELKPGESLLIIGIGGGVASASLQLAKKIGARVMVTSGSDEKLERAKKLGADYGINHHQADFAKAVSDLTDGRGVDVVLDCVGGEVWRRSLASLARGGRLVTCGATAGGQPVDDIAALFSKQLRIYGSTLGSRDEFRLLISFLNAGKNQADHRQRLCVTGRRGCSTICGRGQAVRESNLADFKLEIREHHRQSRLRC
jgi:NADPH:quinone reductase-like Zn-dependent oxidoreductase